MIRETFKKEVSVGGVFQMSSKELDRIYILKKVLNKELSQVKASELLDLTTRQVRNLLKYFSLHGEKGILSKKRGVTSNRSYSKELKSSIMALVREKYEDFGPTLAAEKLNEFDNKVVSKETLRQWMIKAHIWIPSGKKRREHMSRKRKDCFGELSQTDGSIHHWFGDDLPKANATVIIDDATGIITSLYFSERETLEAYYKAFEFYMNRYGRPRAIYTDRYAVFQANNKWGVTNMQKSLKSLDIKLILANSPQAKGRVERANRTLQDRLIKEFRLRGIRSIEEANNFVPEFLESYNEKFSKKPMSDVNAHRSLEGYDLQRLLCRKETRTLLSGCIFQYNKTFYKVQAPPKVLQMKGRQIEIRKMKDGTVRVFMEDKELKVEKAENINKPPEEMTRKEVMIWKDRKLAPHRSNAWRKFRLSNPYKKEYRDNAV